MGVYSYTCAKTHLPVMNYMACSNPEMFTAVVLFPNGEVREGEYDGYGRIAGVKNIYPAMDEGNLKWILKKFYKGEKFADVGLSHDDPGQGHFHNLEELEKVFAAGGFSSYEDYLKWYKAQE